MQMQLYNYAELYEPIPNPEVGLSKRVFLGYKNIEDSRVGSNVTDTTLENLTLADVEQYALQGIRLVNAIVSLRPHKNDLLIPNTYLNTIRARLEFFRQSGVKLSIRFVYTFTKDLSYIEPEPTKATVLAHLSQISTLVNDFSDIIYTVQAGFVGVWGRGIDTNGFSTSPSTFLSDYTDVVNALLMSTPATMYLQVGNWQVLQNFLPPGAPNLGIGSGSYLPFTGQVWNRVGLFNDNFVARFGDLGTYPQTEPEQTNWREFLKQQSKYIPFTATTSYDVNLGGDVRTTPTGFLQELDDFNIGSIDGDIGSAEFGPVSWTTNNTRQQIASKLGYRFVLESAELPIELLPGSQFTVKLRVRNDGFGYLLTEKLINLVFVGLDGQGTYTVPTAINARDWRQKINNVNIIANAPSNLPTGRYSLGLWIPDTANTLSSNPRFSLRFANVGLWNESTGYNILAALSVSNTLVLTTPTNSISLYKKLSSNISNLQERFNDVFIKKSNIYKLFLVVSWQIKSVIDYLDDFRLSYGFYDKPHLNTRIKNYTLPKKFDKSEFKRKFLQGLVRKNDMPNTTNVIDFLWGSVLLSNVTENGIENTVRLYLELMLKNKGVSPSNAKSIAQNVKIYIKNWYENSVSDITDTIYSYNSQQVLRIYLELGIPKKYATTIGSMLYYSKDLIDLLNKKITVGSKVSHIEVNWL